MGMAARTYLLPKLPWSCHCCPETPAALVSNLGRQAPSMGSFASLSTQGVRGGGAVKHGQKAWQALLLPWGHGSTLEAVQKEMAQKASVVTAKRCCSLGKMASGQTWASAEPEEPVLRKSTGFRLVSTGDKGVGGCCLCLGQLSA